MMTPLVVDNVTKTFRQGDRVVTALSSISLQVRQGQFLAIMGASGSGKSTLLHLMAGLARPDSGSIRINDIDLGALPDHQLTRFRRRHIGLVFQSFNLIPTLSAAENIALPLMLDGNNGQPSHQRVDQLLATLGISDRRTHRPDALSGGEQQRVAIGRALVADPAVILADEPTGNLDTVNGQHVLDLLLQLNRAEGTTLVLVTHDPALAKHATRIITLRDGLVISDEQQTTQAGA
jgi:putative ABC transport system ATP-binding protein